MPKNEGKIEEIARRRGFFWQSSEIYGGLSGFYDYAHLGTLMKRKWENYWRNFFIGMDDNFFEIETPTIMHEKVFVASGHVQSFVDPIVKCKKCGNFERADQLMESVLKENFEGESPEALAKIIKEHGIKCPKCKGPLEDVGVLNMLFPVTVGAESPQKAYLRGETAQGAFINFRREFESLRKQIPLGLAIVGKAYRNEISPRQLLIRMREFTQAELQIFFNPEKIDEHRDFDSVKSYKLRLFPVSERSHNKIVEMTCEEALTRLKLPRFYVYYMAMVQKFYLEVVKIPADRFRFRELSEEERAFYNKFHWDIEMYFESMESFKEIGGVHYRTDHDLSGHAKTSKQDMDVFYDGKKFVPHVLELSFGVDRNVYGLMELFYEEEKERSLFRFPRRFAPYDCAIFPLVNKDGLPEMAKEIKKALSLSVFYDASGSVGRRYRRMDEIGVPACLTIDHESVEDGTVTLRDRDSMKQARVKIKDLPDIMNRFLDGEDIEKLGKIVTRGNEEEN
jgi:glycyl-tRNA synthetase